MKLTRQQQRALRVFRYDDGRATDGAVWDEGVRPWPTMDNLVEKGLATRGGWLDPEWGYEYTLTDAGRAASGEDTNG